MSNLPPPGGWSSPSTARNRGPILELLRRWLPAHGMVLEVASGAGEHAAYCAQELPGVQWQPSDADAAALASIAAWRNQADLPNLRAPLRLDAAQPETWPVDRADAMVNINMIHISPWAATLGLMRGAKQVLPAGGVLVLYGPYCETNVIAPSNFEFDANLRARNAAWGVRRLEDVVEAAQAEGLELVERVAMPRDNLGVVLRKG